MTARKRSETPRWRRWIGPGLLAALMLRATVALAASPGVALVLGDSQYAGHPVLPACSQAAQAVSARLQHLGFTVDTAIDATATTLRNALDNFADQIASAPPGAPLIYVCTEATAVDQRLFLLPSDVDLQQPLRPETQGVVIRALVNALAGSKGTLVAELSAPAGTKAAPAVSALQGTLPDGLHLVLTIGDGKQAGVLGKRLASDDVALGAEWNQLATALQNPAPNLAPAIMVYTPAPVAAAPAPQPPEPPPAPPAPAPVIAPPAPQAAPATPEPVQAPTEPTPAPPTRSPPRPTPPRPVERTPERRVARSYPSTPTGDERTRRLQIALAHHGFYGGTLNGVADFRTVEAIRAFQASLGDRASGTLTQTEIVRLLNNW